MALELTLKDPGYEYWVKGGLALQYARKGIEKFVETITDTFHQDVMKSLPAGANCRNCSTENIIPCRNNNHFCKIVNRICKVHDPVDPSKQSLPVCPNYVCDAIRSTITKEHRFNGPSWKNTDCTRWSLEPWQLAKCYMPDGYRSSVSAADTDFPGLLSVVINNTVFNNVVFDNLSSNNNIFIQARQVRNDILHKPDMKLTNQDLADYIAILDTMLTDSKCLAAHPDAVHAKVMLNKILIGQINISSEDERQVRALREMEQKLQESLAKIEAKREDAVEVVKKEVNDAKDDLESKTKELQSTIEKKTSDAKNDLESKTKEIITTIEKKTNDAKDDLESKTKELQSTIEKKTSDSKDDLESKTKEIITTIEKKTNDAKDDLESKTKELQSTIEKKTSDAKDDLESKTKELKSTIERKTSDSKDDLESKTKEIITTIKKKTNDAKDDLESKTKELQSTIEKKTSDSKDDLESKTKEFITTIERKTSDAKDDLESKAKELQTTATDNIKQEQLQAATVYNIYKSEIETAKDNVVNASIVAKKDIKREIDNTITVIKKESNDAKYHIKFVKEGAIKDTKTELKTATEVAKQEIYLVKDDIKIDTKESIKAIAKESSDAQDHIKSVKEGAIKDARIELKTITEEAFTARTTAAHDTHKGTQPSVKTEQPRRPEPVQKPRKLNSQMLKDIKTELLKVYRNSDRLAAPLFPLVQTENMKIDALYVQPNMKHKNTAIDSYKDLFRCGDERNIFVVGDAGLGKTSLCQNIISTWCRVQSDTKLKMKRDSILQNFVSRFFSVKSGKKDIISDDLQAMAQFDFLFYVSLREAVDESDIEEMIKTQLLDSEFHDQVSVVLKNERCLVILDGLDEWTNTNSGAKFCNKGIPGRKASEHLTVLTTTRPWKLDAIQLKQTQIGARVELLGIEETSSKQLIQIMLTYINKDKDKKCHMITEDFLIELAKKNLEHFMAIPVILKQLICLWSAGKDLGQTPTEIYCQMMELLLELAQNRLDKDPAYKQIKDEWHTSTIQLPSCFEGNDTCQEFKPLIFLLSKLAFNAILIKNKESALVFHRKQAEIHGMTESEINICLNIGILSQSGIIKRGKSQRKLSFLHKSYHEFLAALFIALDLGRCDQRVQRIQQHCTTLSELMEMEHLIQFIGGMCSSDTLCALLSYIKSTDIGTRYLQIFIKNGIKEGWCCSHDNEHLCNRTIDINPGDKPEHIELLCQVNIKHLRYLTIRTPPTSRCKEYLQQVHTLSRLTIEPSIAVSFRSSRLSPISEDIMNDLVPHVQNMFSILTKPQLTKEQSSSTSSKSTPISEADLNDTIHHHNNFTRILFERGVFIDPLSSSSSSSIYMIDESIRNAFRQMMQIYRDSYTQRNVTFEPWSSISSRSNPECEQYIYGRIEYIHNSIDRRTERKSATVTSVSSSSTTRSSIISGDILYDLIQNNSHTLEYLYLYNITFRSKTKLSTLLHSLPQLRQLYMDNTTLPQQLLDSLQSIKRLRPNVLIIIDNSQILPYRKCTE